MPTSARPYQAGTAKFIQRKLCRELSAKLKLREIKALYGSLYCGKDAVSVSSISIILIHNHPILLSLEAAALTLAKHSQCISTSVCSCMEIWHSASITLDYTGIVINFICACVD